MTAISYIYAWEQKSFVKGSCLLEDLVFYIYIYLIRPRAELVKLYVCTKTSDYLTLSLKEFLELYTFSLNLVARLHLFSLTAALGIAKRILSGHVF